MGFSEDIKLWSDKVKSLKDKLQTEEAVKHSLVMPFLQHLGYNVFDPSEVVPEFTADHGIKKGEKVDYAILKDGTPHILIEVKSLSCDLGAVQNGQLYRYFSVTKAKFSILTNGVCYQFYSDLDETNRMDAKPFLIVDLENLREQTITELEKFHKKKYDIDIILSTANELKYTNQIKEYIGRQFKDPGEEFIKLVLRQVYDGRLTQQTLQWFEPIVKKATSLFVSELVSERLKSALELDAKEEAKKVEEEAEEAEGQKREVETTEEELEAFVLIRLLLKETLRNGHQLTYKDRLNYFAILLDGNILKWVCRLYLSPKRKMIEFKDGEKVQIESIYEIEKYKDKLINIANDLL